MQPQLVTQGVDIVLRGQFNPAMFHPAWFAAQNLIRQQEVEAAEIKIIHPDAAIFDVEWLQIRVTRDRFQATTVQEAYYETLRDVVMGVFTVLNQTPLRVIGINRNFHYGLESEKAWHAVGDRLAPKQDWTETLNSPGMKSLSMQGLRPDDYSGYILVKVEPLNRSDFGVFVEVNDHYELTSDSETPTSDIITILSENWQESMNRGMDITTKIVSLGDLNK